VVSEETVKTHMRALFAAFDLADAEQYHKRAELARRAVAAGLVGRGTAAV
jgi:DNA-binding NarL/FixJ family response regulator